MTDFNASKYINNNPRWRAVRKLVLASNPLCAVCLSKGKRVAATEIDHVVDRRKLTSVNDIYDRFNLQSLCKPCHSSKTNLGRKHKPGIRRKRVKKKEKVALDWCGDVPETVATPTPSPPGGEFSVRYLS